MDVNHLIGPVLGALAAILGAAATFSKLKASFREELREETDKAIEYARDAARNDVELLKVQVENLSKEINRLEDSFQKDVAHIRETYNNEIRNLGNKIEELREEVRGQHSQLVTLLTKLVSNR